MPFTSSLKNLYDTFISQTQSVIEPLESRLLKSLQQTQQNKDEILKLIDELKKDDSTLSKTIDVEVEGGKINYSILGMIIEYGKEEIVKDLIDAVKDNIDINAVVKKDKDGTANTALDVAMSKGEIEVIKTLLENGANYDRFSLIVEQKAFLREINFFSNHICDHFLEKTDPISLNENEKALATGLLKIHSTRFDSITDLSIEMNSNGSSTSTDLSIEMNSNGSSTSYLKGSVTFPLNAQVYSDLYDSFAELFLNENSNGSPSRYLKAGSFTCPLNAQDEIDRIMKTQKVFEGDLSIPADEINQNYLKYLSKKRSLTQAHQESVASESSQSSTETQLPSSVTEVKRKPETSEMQLFQSQSKSARGE